MVRSQRLNGRGSTMTDDQSRVGLRYSLAPCESKGNDRDDFADQGEKVMHSSTNVLTSLFVRGRHLSGRATKTKKWPFYAPRFWLQIDRPSPTLSILSLLLFSPFNHTAPFVCPLPLPSHSISFAGRRAISWCSFHAFNLHLRAFPNCLNCQKMILTI